MVDVTVKLKGRKAYTRWVRTTAEAREMKRFIGRAGTVTYKTERAVKKRSAPRRSSGFFGI